MEIAPGLHALGQKKGGRVHAFLAESDGGELTLIEERSLRRMASFEPLVVGVGHGEPLSDGTPDCVHALAERARHV